MRRSLPAFAALLLAGCGYVGDPLPPLANVPKRVDDLAAIQRGATVIVQFTAPSTTTEGHPIPAPVKLDLRAGPAEQFDENQWAASAPSDSARRAFGPYRPLRNSGHRLGGQRDHFRSAHRRRKREAVHLVELRGRPRAAASGEARGRHRHGHRGRSPGDLEGAGRGVPCLPKTADGDFTLAATVQKPEYLDPQAEFGKPVSYIVQTIAHHDAKIAESELSDPVSITPADTFPPSPPAGLHASAAPMSIELTWDRNNEADLAAYRIYRSVANGAFEKLAEVTAVPTFSDRGVEAGKSYRYAVTAVDRAGNESARSAVVEVVLP